MSVKAKYIKDLPLKNELDGSESLLVQDSNGTKQAPLETIIDEIKQNSQEEIREIESELNQTNAQLSEKIYKFRSVADMKSYDLNAGDICITLGYYSANDGGHGMYVVRNKTASEPGEGFVHLINNGLIAELIFNDNKVNFRQLGALSEQDTTFNHIDCKNYLDIYLNYMSINSNSHLKLVIPSGIWVFSETLINTPNVDIEGEPQFFNNFNTNGTIITALTNQRYVWKLGDNGNFDYSNPQDTKRQINVSGMTFSSGLYENVSKPTSLFAIEKSALYIDNICFCNFKRLNFNYIYGTALALSTCWELYFDILNFRYIFDHNKPCMLFDDVHLAAGVGFPNISAVEINSIMFEVCNGDYVDFSKDSSFTNSIINYINIEGSFANGYQDKGTTGTASDSETYQSECVIALGSARNVNIGTINSQLLGTDTHECNGVKYCRNMVFNYKHSDNDHPSRFFGVVNNIVMELTTIGVTLVNQEEDVIVKYQNKLVINNVVSHCSRTKAAPTFNVSSFEGLFIDNIYTIDEGINATSNNLMKLPYDYCFLNSGGSWNNRTIVSDKNSFLPVNLCVKKLENNNNDIVMTLDLFKPSVVSLLIKIPQDEQIQVVYSYKLNGQEKIKYPPFITGTGEYKWYDFDLTDITCDSDSYLRVYTSSSVYFALYDIK